MLIHTALNEVILSSWVPDSSLLGPEVLPRCKTRPGAYKKPSEQLSDADGHDALGGLGSCAALSQLHSVGQDGSSVTIIIFYKTMITARKCSNYYELLSSESA